MTTEKLTQNAVKEQKLFFKGMIQMFSANNYKKLKNIDAFS